MSATILLNRHRKRPSAVRSFASNWLRENQYNACHDHQSIHCLCRLGPDGLDGPQRHRSWNEAPDGGFVDKEQLRSVPADPASNPGPRPANLLLEPSRREQLPFQDLWRRHL